MSAKTVRAAIASFLQQADTPGLNLISKTMLMETPAEQAVAKGNAGAAGYIWLITHSETVASTGLPSNIQPSGWRIIAYQAALIFDYYVLTPSTSDDSWTDGLDDMVQAIKVALRSDPNIGTYGQGDCTIFSAANDFPSGNPSITVVLEAPAVLPDTQGWLVHGSIDFPVYETVQPGTPDY